MSHCSLMAQRYEALRQEVLSLGCAHFDEMPSQFFDALNKASVEMVTAGGRYDEFYALCENAIVHNYWNNEALQLMCQTLAVLLAGEPGQQSVQQKRGRSVSLPSCLSV